MATVREGERSVLLVVDVQVGVLDGAWESERIVKNVALAVERARTGGVPVIWVQHDDDGLVHGSPEWEYVPELVAAPGEPLVRKHHHSSFEGTELEALLAGLGATHIVLAGAATNWCIRATAYAALDRGYDLTLLSDAHTTTSGTLENGLKLEAECIVEELNIAMTWLSYPGRQNGVARAAEVNFSGGSQP